MVSTGVWLIHVLATEKTENVALEMVDRKKGWQSLPDSYSVVLNFSVKRKVRIG